MVITSSNDRLHVDGFYKAHFSSSPRRGVALAPDIWADHHRVSMAQNAALTAPFTEKEAPMAIKGMNPTSASGPDGLQVKFF